MAAFHKVEVALNKQSITVGSPSPQTVNVVVPRIGPKGDTGNVGPTGSTGATGATGAAGADGREVELQTTATHIQWRYVGESTWNDLVALSTITGPQGIQGEIGNTGATGASGADGREVELQKTATHVQWRYEGDVAWTDLIPLADITGPQGPAGTVTTNAADLTSGTLADARLSANVPLLNAANTFSANQTLNGTNNVAPNQTAASASSLMTRDLVDFRSVSRSSDEVWVADDFVFANNIGWDASSTGSGASNSLGAGTNDHPGIRVMVSGQTTGWSRTRVRGNNFISVSGLNFEMVGIVRLDTLTNTYAIFGGTTSTQDHGGWPIFMYDSSVSANWRVSGGNLSGYVNTNYAATTGWVFLRAWRYATSGNINYEIRATRTGTLHASGTVTDGLNSSPQDFGCVVKVPGGAAAANPSMTIDYLSGRAWNINR